jgi:hypothetical protein
MENKRVTDDQFKFMYRYSHKKTRSQKIVDQVYTHDINPHLQMNFVASFTKLRSAQQLSLVAILRWLYVEALQHKNKCVVVASCSLIIRGVIGKKIKSGIN